VSKETNLVSEGFSFSIFYNNIIIIINNNILQLKFPSY
jgi:hypothetical protein